MDGIFTVLHLDTLRFPFDVRTDAGDRTGIT